MLLDDVPCCDDDDPSDEATAEHVARPIPSGHVPKKKTRAEAKTACACCATPLSPQVRAAGHTSCAACRAAMPRVRLLHRIARCPRRQVTSAPMWWAEADPYKNEVCFACVLQLQARLMGLR